MVYAVVIDKTELGLVALKKMFIAVSREIKPSLALIYLRGTENAEEKIKEIKEKAERDKIALDVKIIDYEGLERNAENVCRMALQLNAAGIFVPEHMHLLREQIEAYCNKTPECRLAVETISMHILPLVYDLMSKNISEISPDTTLHDAAKIMIDRRIGSLVVVNNDGKLIGIITEHDFVRNAYKNGSAKKVTIKEIMSQPVITITRYESVLDACMLFMKHRIKKLVVVDEKDTPIGVITTTDLAKMPLTLFENINSILSNFRTH